MSIKAAIITIVSLGLLLFGCAPQQIQITTIIEDDDAIEATQTSAQPGAAEIAKEIPGAVIDGNNQFAIELYLQQAANKGNLFFSPYGISKVLTMAYEGANGKTAEEMRQTLHLPDDKEQIRTAFAGMHRELNQDTKVYSLSTADALWAQKDDPFNRSYFENINQYYKGTIANLDFSNDPKNSRRAINKWVADRTNQRIDELISQGLIFPDTGLVLTNAIHFKADWSNEFEVKSTQNGQFQPEPGNNSKAQMMHQTDDFNYGETQDRQILEMDYRGNKLSMLLILPKKDNLASLESVFDGVQLTKWKESMKRQKVRVTIPKFEFENKYLLAANLKEMGMPTALSGDADFTAMSQDELFIGEVVHQARIAVAEYGTEASAASAVTMQKAAAIGPADQPAVFTADHPFIFIIQQKATGSILFIGRVSDPNLENLGEH